MDARATVVTKDRDCDARPGNRSTLSRRRESIARQDALVRFDIHSDRARNRPVAMVQQRAQRRDGGLGLAKSTEHRVNRHASPQEEEEEVPHHHHFELADQNHRYLYLRLRREIMSETASRIPRLVDFDVGSTPVGRNLIPGLDSHRANRPPKKSSSSCIEERRGSSRPVTTYEGIRVAAW